MSFWKRVGNLGKGLLKTVGSDHASMEREARERALEEELACLRPTPKPALPRQTAPEPEDMPHAPAEPPPLKRTL